MSISGEIQRARSLSASPQNDATVGSIVSTGEQQFSQHDMGVIIAAAVVAYRPSLIPVVRHWADSAAGFPCGSAAEGGCDEETDDSCVGGLPQGPELGLRPAPG